MPFRAAFQCLWCGRTHRARSASDLEGWALLCPECLGRAGENPFLRFRLKQALAERSREGHRDPSIQGLPDDTNGADAGDPVAGDAGPSVGGRAGDAAAGEPDDAAGDARDLVAGDAGHPAAGEPDGPGADPGDPAPGMPDAG